MIKEAWRDYATHMFRTYAEHGCENAERVRERIIEREKRKREWSDASLGEARAKKIAERYKRKLDDIAIVDAVFREFNENGKGYITDVVRAVYLIQPSRGLRKGDVSARVRRFAYEYHVTEKQAYAWLKEARKAVAYAKGLDTDN